MATTRIMPLHVGKGRTESRAISDIIDYVANPKKTDDGRLITGYACDSRTVDAEFLLAKRQYIAATGRVRGADDVIAYHVRQSFRPGEITPEEANRLGVEFAKRFTKGNHAFVVCTHIDKSHIHNHIIWSSVSLEYDRKFRNFWGSTKAVRQLSDTICIENGLSIVENPKPHGKSYNKWLGDQAKPSHRELLRVAMPNEKLKWQQTDTWNIGLEMGLLNGRITARAEYFQKLTKNSLTQVTLAPSLGFGSYPENMGTLENKGVELNFAFIPYQNTAKSAYWTISVNGSHNTDKLKKISEALRHMNEENYNEQGDSPLPHYEEGESINRIWAVKSLGIDPMTGEEILLKRNGKMTGEYDVVDLVPCGTTEPKWQGNINSSFAYKGFGVDVSMAYKFGGQVYNQTLVHKVENADLMRNADKRVLDLRWMKVGDTAKFKGMNTGIDGAGTKATSRFVMDENTFQMTSIALSYRMDRTNTKFLERWGLSSVKFAFNMEDLFYLSSVKQERGTDYPFARRFSFSLNVAF